MAPILRAWAFGCAALLSAAAAADQRGHASWADGEQAWREEKASSVARSKEAQLWEKENACDPGVLKDAAPLTVLFGLSTLWSEIEQGRPKAGGHTTGRPLEIHVLGASYPFEGRSDWSLLAARRPATVPKVRVVLVLGTPWQADNVPEMEHSALLQDHKRTRRGGRHHRDPTAGYWDTTSAKMKCPNAAEDAVFDKAAYCRDHGNGLEVVCVEQLYQDAVGSLPKPDVAIMFNPGFPQMARRTWDSVLLRLLKKKVATLVVSEVFGRTRRDILSKAPEGGPWQPQTSGGEDFWTSVALQQYGARMLGIYRNPFPLFTHDEGEGVEHREIIAKDLVVHAFRGLDGQTPLPQRLTARSAERRRLYLEGLDWRALAEASGHDLTELMEMKKALVLPVSRSYEEALSSYYAPEVVDQIAGLGGWGKLPAATRRGLRRMGFEAAKGGRHVAAPRTARHWTPKDYVFLAEHLRMCFN